MRRRTIAHAVMAVGGVVAAGMACADEVQIYGRLYTTLEYNWQSSGNNGQSTPSTTRMTNDRSVWGLRGNENLGGGYRAIWQIESDLTLPNGAGGMASRDSRVGLDGPFGTFFLGNWTTPFTESTKAFDPFYPTTAGYMSLMGNGSAPSADNVSNTTSFDRRQQNSVNYVSPTWRGLSAAAQWGVNQERVALSRNPMLLSFSVTYTAGPLVLTAAQENHRDYQGNHTEDNGTKIGASYRLFAGTVVSAAYERLRYQTPTTAVRRDAVYLSLVQRLGPGNLMAGVTWAGNGVGNTKTPIGFISSGSETGAMQYTLGYDYALSRRTSLVAFYSHITNGSRASYNWAINSVPNVTGGSLSLVALGMKHAF
ncbi:porin [Pandoraea pneumonica]|uniref:porin n=1 Tax=Pandoraea pneumonica TaxID=2508299 RepID=UPI003CF20BF6